MDNGEIQILCESIIRLRKERFKLNLEIEEKRKKLMDYMEKNKKRIFTTGDYSIERKPKHIKTLKKDLKLPQEYFETKIVYQLYVKSKGDLTLEGNKFVLK